MMQPDQHITPLFLFNSFKYYFRMIPILNFKPQSYTKSLIHTKCLAKKNQGIHQIHYLIINIKSSSVQGM